MIRSSRRSAIEARKKCVYVVHSDTESDDDSVNSVQDRKGKSHSRFSNGGLRDNASEARNSVSSVDEGTLGPELKGSTLGKSYILSVEIECRQVNAEISVNHGKRRRTRAPSPSASARTSGRGNSRAKRLKVSSESEDSDVSSYRQDDDSVSDFEESDPSDFIDEDEDEEDEEDEVEVEDELGEGSVEQEDEREEEDVISVVREKREPKRKATTTSKRKGTVGYRLPTLSWLTSPVGLDQPT